MTSIRIDSQRRDHERRLSALIKGAPRKCSICQQVKPKVEYLPADNRLVLRQSCRACRGLPPYSQAAPAAPRAQGDKEPGNPGQPRPPRAPRVRRGSMFEDWGDDPFDALARVAGDGVGRSDICPLG